MVYEAPALPAIAWAMLRFVLTFDSFQDPSPEQTRALLDSLPPLVVVDQFPGSVLVEGLQQDVVHALMKVQGWTWSSAVEIPAPSRPAVRD